MTTADNTDSTGTPKNIGARTPSPRRLPDVRAEIMRLETRLGAIEIGVRQARQELADLEGFTLGAMMSGLFGQKSASVARLRQQLDIFEKQQTETNYALNHLRDELARLDVEVVSGPSPAPRQTNVNAATCASRDGADATASPGVAPDCDARQKTAAALKQAMDAGDEAMKDLREEIETAASLGRRRLLEKNLLMRTMMNGARRGATRQCASRVIRSIARFQRLVEAVMTNHGLNSDPSLAEAVVVISSITGAADGDSFRDTMTSIALDTIYTQLQMATMLVEKAHTDARTRLTGLPNGNAPAQS